MLSNVFLKTLYDMRWSMLAWAIIFVLMSMMMVSFFPSIEESASDMQDYIDNLPDAFKGMFGGEDIDLNTIEGYLSIELFSFFYPFMMLSFTILYGAGLIAGEEDSGTLDLLLSTPVPRWRIVLEKFLALVVFTVVVLAASYLGLLVGAPLAGVDNMDAGLMLGATIQMGLLGLFFGGLALAITGTQGARGMALGVTLGIAAITYLLFTMSDLAHLPDVLTWLSPWYYYDGANVARDGVPVGYSALLAGATVLLVGVGMIAFQRRDVGT